MSGTIKRQLLDRLVRNRFRSNKDLVRILDEHGERAVQGLQRKRSRPHVLRGVHRGNYYRVSVRPPPPSPLLPNVPKIPPPMSAQPPVAFKTVPPAATAPAAEASCSTTTAPAASAPTGAGATSASSSSSASGSAGATQAGKRGMIFASALSSEFVRDDYRRRLRDWWKENWSVLVLNIGSICTLMAFTRSDVLELRSLSVVGSTCSVIYQLTMVPVRWPPVLWSMLFAGVNSYKISTILRERNSFVRLTGDEERMYVQHFLPHGVTPKQFEIVLHRAKVKSYPKGSVILRQGEKLEKVQLVVQGATRATILGRRVSAASMPASACADDVDGRGDDDSDASERSPTSHVTRASAWIGEMTFLERYWRQEQLLLHPPKPREKAPSASSTESPKARIPQPPDATTKEPNGASPDLASELLVVAEHGSPGESGPPASKAPSTGARAATGKGGEVVLASKRTVRPVHASGLSAVPEAKTDYSMYTIVALEDSTVLEWSHDDMQALMERSTDLRSALTRALSSAVVGKVINFTISKSQAHRSWSQWLDDWKHSDGATIQVQEDEEGAAAAESKGPSTRVGEPLVQESLPTHPIKKYA